MRKLRHITQHPSLGQTPDRNFPGRIEADDPTWIVEEPSSNNIQGPIKAAFFFARACVKDQ
jgi:hypothetical protein